MIKMTRDDDSVSDSQFESIHDSSDRSRSINIQEFVDGETSPDSPGLFTQDSHRTKRNNLNNLQVKETTGSLKQKTMESLLSPQ